MGCGHSKINIYPRKAHRKHSSKKSGKNNENENNCNDVYGVDTEVTKCENNLKQNTESQLRDIDDSDEIIFLQDNEDSSDGGKAKTKPHVGGPLSAHTEISQSQQNFFRMLDEKIENGPDYDPSSDVEKFKENQRLNTLLQDWETASSTSRSLPSTPKHYHQQHQQHNVLPYHENVNHVNEQQKLLYYQQYACYLPQQRPGLGPITSNQSNSQAAIRYSSPPPNLIHHQYPPNIRQPYNPGPNYQQYNSPTHQPVPNHTPKQFYPPQQAVLQRQYHNPVPQTPQPQHFHVVPQHMMPNTAPVRYASNPSQYDPQRKSDQQYPMYTSRSPVPNTKSDYAQDLQLKQQLYEQQLQYQQSKSMQYQKISNSSAQQQLMHQQQVQKQLVQQQQQQIYCSGPLGNSSGSNVVISKIGNTNSSGSGAMYPIIKNNQSTNNVDMRSSTGTDPMSPKLMYRKKIAHDLT